MRLIHAAITAGVAAAMLFTGPASTAQEIQRTDGNSFLEVNAAGELVRWTRSGGSFVRQVRGTGWDKTHAITSLDANNFLEIKPDYRLSKWTWNGRGYIERNVGVGWDNAKAIAGISAGCFVEVNRQNELKRWCFNASGNLVAEVIGTGWDANSTVALAGMGYVNFLRLDNVFRWNLTEWSDFVTHGRNLTSHNIFTSAQAIRLIVGTAVGNFLVVDHAGELLEYRKKDGYWPRPGTRVGWGWQTARLLG